LKKGGKADYSESMQALSTIRLLSKGESGCSELLLEQMPKGHIAKVHQNLLLENND
jgi:hypothetical protein